MLILGIHFGHDSSITLLENGKIVFCIEKERTCRVRHVIGISFKDIDGALKNFNYKIDQIDYCSVTSTQNVEYIFFDKKLHFELDVKKLNQDTAHWYHKKRKNINEQIKKKFLINLIKKKSNHPYLKKIEKKLLNSKYLNFFGSIEDFYQKKTWLKKNRLNEIEKLLIKSKIKEPMQLPIKLHLGNRSIPGFIVSHHFAHAAYSYYSSNFNDAIILTQDGSIPITPYLSGMCYYGKKNKLFPVIPHYLDLGRIYDTVSELIGFDRASGPGKTMGLAPYGKPKFFDKKFIGNFFDHQKIKVKNFKSSIVKWRPHKLDHGSNKWIMHCLNLAKKLNYCLKELGDKRKILSSINTDIASSTQILLEQTFLHVIKKIKKIFFKNKLKSKNLCLSGGTFLNCPANSKIYNEKIFKNIFLPPAVHDGGLSIGSAQAIYFNSLNKRRVMNLPNKVEAAFLGKRYKIKSLNKILKKNSKYLSFSIQKNIFKKIAENLSKNKIVAVHFGRSEIGPRALGNRSILADARNPKNWRKVNKIKTREYWRPFAPVVLKKDFKKYFYNSPKLSPYMLFTAKVKDASIPAITHVDKSSRAQTVENKKNPIYKVLSEFKKITGISVLMNTSFNGPGQPIVETYEDAVEFFINSELDNLYIDNFEIKKRA